MINLLPRFLDLIAPRVCPVCGNRLMLQETVCCTGCLLNLAPTHFENNPFENYMATLFYGLMPVEKAVAVFYYKSGNHLAHIVEHFKYENQPQLAYEMGRLCAQRLLKSNFFEGIDCLVPVPLTRKRQRNRGYNQSMQLAKGIADVVGLPIESKAVERIIFNKSQTRLDRMQRNLNTENTFKLCKPQLLTHKNVLIIDDVCTTGATLRACGNEMLKAEGVTLNILTLGFTMD